jgi:hypothetical protein
MIATAHILELASEVHNIQANRTFQKQVSASSAPCNR